MIARICVAICFLLVVGVAIAIPLGHSKRARISGPWKLVLDARFQGSSLDTDLWRPGWFGSGVTPPADSDSASCDSSRNVTVGGGHVTLAVTNQASTCGGQTKPYTGGLVSTNPHDGRSHGGFEYTYGLLQVRAYVPADGADLANWPAVWADGQDWPDNGENDVMEGLAGHACFHFHSSAGDSGTCDKHLRPGWHTFSASWEPGEVTYFYDGRRVGRITAGVTGAPMYIVLSNNVRGDDDTTAEPSRMSVAYVRVWQHRS